MRELKTKTLRGISWSGFGHFVKLISAFVISVLLARLLTPADFGLVAMVVIVTGFCRTLTNTGLGTALVQRADISQLHMSSVFWANLVLAAILTCLITILAPTIAIFYGAPGLKSISTAIALIFFVEAFGVVHRSMAEREMNFRLLVTIDMSATIVAGVSTIFLALAGFGVWSLILQYLISNTVTAILLWLLIKWRPLLSFRFSALKELMGFSSQLFTYNIITYWSRNLDNLLIGKFIGSYALGIYSRSYNLMLLPISQITYVLSKVMFPALSSIQSDIPRVKYIYLRAIRIISLVSFPLMIGLWVVTDHFVLAVYGPKWEGIIPVLRILCLVGLMQSIGATAGWIYNSQGRTDVQLKWGLLSGLVYGLAFTIGLRWGVNGVAWAYFGANVLLLYPAWTMPGKLIGIEFKEMIASLFRTFACSAVMGILIYFLKQALPNGWQHWHYLGVLIVCAVAVYMYLLEILDIPAYSEIKELMVKGFGFNKPVAATGGIGVEPLQQTGHQK